MTSGPPQQPRHGSRTDERKRIAGIVVLVAVAIWLVAFIVSNSESVRVSFVFGHVSLSLIWVMIICAVLGGFIAVAVPRLLRRRK